jgi:hypothetical protein
MANAVKLRKKTMKESNLPYCFTYKIRQAFWGQKCPVCGIEMCHHEFCGRNFFPTIQHNHPLSMGGKHELDNISVICKRCNVTLQNTPTPKLNNDVVKQVWVQICEEAKHTKSKGGRRTWLM